ncbi:hypothetical protein GCM10009066_20250 [Halarchaeum salinum]|uniref:Uncharacterized protein n=1 Tax=Halarchaeum salinum TaxID=489912 RepID=A0AAV3S9J7_9EURY
MCAEAKGAPVSALHRRPLVVGAAVALAVGGVAHYWFADAWLTGALTLCYSDTHSRRSSLVPMASITRWTSRPVPKSGS